MSVAIRSRRKLHNAVRGRGVVYIVCMSLRFGLRESQYVGVGLAALYDTGMFIAWHTMHSGTQMIRSRTFVHTVREY